MKRRDLLCAAAVAALALPPLAHGAAEDGAEGDRRPRARLSHRRGGGAHGQEARGADERPAVDPDVPRHAARRREGDDRAGAGRRAADRAHLGRPDGADRRRAERLQPAVHVPRRGAHARGDRRPDRQGAARQAHRQPEREARRPVLDGRRHAQRLREEADQGTGRPQGPEDPDDGQPDLRRDDERDGRERRRDGLQRALQRAADRRGRRRGEQPAVAAHPEPLSGHQVLQPDRPPDHPRDPRVLEGELGQALEGRPGADREARRARRRWRRAGCGTRWSPTRSPS